MADLAAENSPLDVHSKALAINLDPTVYGSLAEIGAGQEVARWLFRVGGASGTIAQTISAYDKTFSDDTYGVGTRYVSKERLLAMLEHEYGLLLGRLGPTRGANTRFFAFANTASARNYKGDNEQHAWLGLRFQDAPGAPHSQVLLHVNLLDSTAQLQQQSLGSLGINLLYGAYYQRSSAEPFLTCLWDTLSLNQLEVDILELTGPAFAGSDSRLWCLQMLRREMARAIVFDKQIQLVEPTSVLRKRPLVVERGQFKTVEPFYQKTLVASHRQLAHEGVRLDRDAVSVLEMTVSNVSGVEAPSDAEILARVKSVSELGTVIVSRFAEGYRLAEYLRRYTQEPIRFAGGTSQLARILVERFYHELPGQLLEGLGKLLAENVKLYAYPMPVDEVLKDLTSDADRFRVTPSAAGLVGADDLHPAPPVNHLYKYLREAGWIIPLAPD